MDFEATPHKPEKGRVDPWLLLVVLVLSGIGIVMIYSASFVRASAIQGHALYFLKRQIVWVVGCSLLMILAGAINYRKLASAPVVWALWAATAVSLIMVFFPPFGMKIAKTHRWLYFGFAQFQPAEFAKLVTAIMVSYFAFKKQEQIRSLTKGVLPLAAGPAIFIILINFQPDLGSCIVIGLIVTVILFVAGTRLIYLGGVAALGIVAAAAAILIKPYRVQRILTFLDPWSDMQGQGYQIIQSMISFGSGGLTGLGLGEGRQKLFYLPEPHTDFILATVGEEFGLIGLWIVLGLFAFLLYRAFRISMRAPDRFGRLLGFSLATLLALQILINAMVVMGLLPNKGLALPFMSYGGSSALLNFLTVGVLLSISRSLHKNSDEVEAEHSQTFTFGEMAR